MSEKSLKPQQIDAIQKDTDLLISANAGSGKTFVMLKRVLHYIINKNMNITDFLLVTFTDAAASEMRFKLQDELVEAYYQARTPEIKKHIKKQINLLPQADISTIHTFCFKLIKKYFYLIDINANVSIADEEESEVIKQNALEQTLDFFARSRSEDFIFLASSYDSKRNFNSIKDITLKIFNFLQNQPDETAFYNQIDKIYNDIDSSQITGVINDYVCFVCEHFANVFKQEKQNAMQAGFDKLVLFCEEIEEKLSAVKKENSFAQNHGIIFDIKLPTKPRKVDDLVLEELCEHSTLQKEKLQKEIKGLKEKVYLNSDITSLKENLKWCKQNVEMLMRVEKRFEEEYKQLKEKRNLVDFSDLEKYALKILKSEQREDIIKDKKFIFVDEYQDVNNIQEQIILSLHDERYNKLFLVGDPKQSIYRFRNTNPQIIIDKQKAFKESKAQDAISLVFNFRSQKPILDFVNFVFEKIMTNETAGIDYQQGNNFQTDNTSNEPAVEINLILKEQVQKEKIVPTEVYSVIEAPVKEEEESDFAKSEAYIISERIASLIEEAKKKNEPFSYRDIAILHRSRSPYVDKVIEVLKECGIPISSSSDENLMEEYEIKVLVDFLKLLLSCDDDYALSGFLTSPIINMTFDELSALCKDKSLSFYENIKKEKETNAKIKLLFSLICEGREKLNNGSIYEVLTDLILKTNYYTLLLSMENGDAKVNNARAYVSHFLLHKYNFDLVGYLSYLDSSLDIAISQQKGGSENSVAVMTMHQSKGLEFKYVFIINASTKFNTKSLEGDCLLSPELGIGVYHFNKINRVKTSTLARSAIIIKERQEQFAEHLRVLYVALTRAKNKLFISGKFSADKVFSELGTYSILKENNYMSLILSCLKPAEQNAISLGKTNLNIKTENSSFFINVYSPIAKNEQLPVQINAKVRKISSQADILCKNIEQIEQKTKQANNQTALKTSVSRVMETEDFKAMQSESVINFNFKENEVTASDIGNAYHYAMQIIPFNLKEDEEVKKFLEENLAENVLKLIDYHKITKCLEVLRQWTSGADKIIREGKFYLYVPHNKVVCGSKITDKILIQGIVDLVIIKGDETILLDYKTTRQNSADILKEKYKIQMECYQIAVENALKRPVSSKILYSFYKDCAILFDK